MCSSENIVTTKRLYGSLCDGHRDALSHKGLGGGGWRTPPQPPELYPSLHPCLSNTRCWFRQFVVIAWTRWGGGGGKSAVVGPLDVTPTLSGRASLAALGGPTRCSTCILGANPPPPCPAAPYPGCLWQHRPELTLDQGTIYHDMSQFTPPPPPNSRMPEPHENYTHPCRGVAYLLHSAWYMQKDMVHCSENQEAKYATRAIMTQSASLTQSMSIKHLKTKVSDSTHSTQ